MEKGDTIKYVVIVLVLAGLAGILFVFKPGPTGYAVLGDYTTQEDCETAGYAWEDFTEENCTERNICVEMETDCDENCTECVEAVMKCTDLNYTIQVDCEYANFTWQEISKENCTERDLCLEGCQEECPECVDVVVGGQCTGDICDSDNLNLCMDASDCQGAGGYWWDDDADGTITCNSVDECTPDCSGKECGDDGCDGSCGTCDSGYTCSSGTCEEEEEESSSTSSSETDSDEELKISSIENYISLSAGETKSSSLNIENIGAFYRGCEVEDSEWIIKGEQKGINKGENADVEFEISVPAGTEAGDYTKEIKIKCTGGLAETESIVITVVFSGSASITGEVVSEGAEEVEATSGGITGFAVLEGTGARVTAYLVFLLVLAAAVFFVWRRHGEIKFLDSWITGFKNWRANRS